VAVIALIFLYYLPNDYKTYNVSAIEILFSATTHGANSQH